MEKFRSLAIKDTKDRFPYEADLPKSAIQRRLQIIDELRAIELPKLGRGRRPNSNDFQGITAYGKAILSLCENFGVISKCDIEYDFDSKAGDPRFFVSQNRMDYSRGRQIFTKSKVGLHSLGFEELAFMVCQSGCLFLAPEPEFIYLKPYWLHSGMKDEVPVYKVEQYKGLEADAIVLIVSHVSRDIDRYLYVGASRSRGCLELLVAEPALSRTSRLYS